MKKPILTFLFLSILQFYQAQPEKGIKSIGGGINLSHNGQNSKGYSKNGIKNNNYGLNLNYDYFIKDNFSIGGGINSGYFQMTQFQTISDKLESSVKMKQKQIGLSINATHYKKIIEKFYYSTQTSLFYNYNTSIYNFSGEYRQYNNNNIAFTISPGFTYFATPKIGFRLQSTFFSLNYGNNQFPNQLYNNSTSTYSESKIIQNSFGHSFSLGYPTFIFNYYF
jgi:hypothetical protein